MSKIDKIQKGHVSGELKVLSVKRMAFKTTMGRRIARVRCSCGYEYDTNAEYFTKKKPPQKCSPCAKKQAKKVNRWNNNFPED